MEHEQLNIGTILEGVDDLYERTVFLPDTGLPEPPPELVRRFVFEQVDTDEGTRTMVDDAALPDDLVDRWWNARCFRQDLLTASRPGWVDLATYDFWQTPCNPVTLECFLTPSDIWDLYHWHKDYAVDMEFDELLADFDLHDTYVSMEEHLLERYRWREGYGPDSDDAFSNERYIKQVESILHVVGQAVSTELEPDPLK